MSLCPHQDPTSIQLCSLPLNIITSSSCTKCPCSPPHSSDQTESGLFFVQIVSLFSLVFSGSHYQVKDVPPSYRVQLLRPHPLHISMHVVVARGLKTRQHLHLCPTCSQSVPSSPLDRSPPKAIRVSICPQQVSRVWTPVLSCGHALFGGNTITKPSL